jgi:acyl-CoA synthetase (NDP forming)/RimJ/RimL family protein N-acetyltransferase
METVTAVRPPVMDALTADGALVQLRPAVPDDAEMLRALHASASPDNLRLRFFSAASTSTVTDEVNRLLRPAAPDHDAVVATQEGAIVGVASYERRTGDRSVAEFAVFVADAQHGRGIGTLLLEFLAARAHAQGISKLVGEVLAANSPMMTVARGLGDRGPHKYDFGVVDVTISTIVDEAALAELDARDQTSRAASLRALLAPRSVAVVGAGRDHNSIGRAVLRQLVAGGFTGELYAINPNAVELEGVTAYPSLTAIERPVDLIIVCVPAPMVTEVLTEAGERGVRGAVVISSGFGEAGSEGRARQREILRIARHYGMRVIGPNCMGVLNTDPEVRLAAAFGPVLPPAGGLALASQSGAVGIAVLDYAARSGSGVSSFVSLGNKVDVSGNDLLSYWFNDPATTAVALYLESFGNPRRFARIARAIARRKPVIAVVSGRSAAGQRAGASHTAAAASPAVAVEALCQQAGIIRVDNLGELIDVARVVTDQPPLRGNRLAVVGNGGGVNVLAVDAADAAGLAVLDFSEQLRTELHQFVPAAANPLDLGAAGNPAGFAGAFELIAKSGEADALIVVVGSTAANDVDGILAELATAIDRWPELPVVVVVLGAASAPTVGSRRVPVFDLPERAVSALGKASAYAHWRREPLGARPELTDIDAVTARGVVRTALDRDGGWQPHGRIAEILGRYGIPVVPTATTIGERATIIQASRFQGPVVLKAADPYLVHKSDVGAVQLGLIGEAQVRAAYRAIATALGVAEPAVLVQPMAERGVELVAGIVHDPLFGSLVMTGLGGVHTDLFADRSLRLVPVTDRDAEQMWRSLKAAPLLTGFRGSTPVDTTAIEDLVLRLGRLAEDLPEVAELDLNPVIVSASGLVVVDAKMRLAPVDVEPDERLRSLSAS